MEVEDKALKAELGCVKAQDLNDLGSGNTSCGGVKVGEVSADWVVRFSTIFPEVEET